MNLYLFVERQIAKAVNYWKNLFIFFMFYGSWFVQLTWLSSRLLNNVTGFFVAFGKAAHQYY